MAAPASASGASAGAAPIEVRPVSSKGWSTSRRAAARREKRTFAIIAASALLAGSLGAFLFVRSREPAAPPPREADEISVQLEANVAGARFAVDGAPVQSGVLKGQKGEVKRVRIEAEGYAPTELDVKLSADEEPVHIVLAATTIAASAALPVISPVVDAAAARTAEPGKKPPRDPGKASAASPIAPPTATPGVGGQL